MVWSRSWDKRAGAAEEDKDAGVEVGEGMVYLRCVSSFEYGVDTWNLL